MTSYLITFHASLVVEAESEKEAVEKFECGLYDDNEVEYGDTCEVELY